MAIRQNKSQWLSERDGVGTATPGPCVLREESSQWLSERDGVGTAHGAFRKIY